MSFTQIHFQPISCQYPSRKHTTSYHTEWVQVKKQFTHFAHSQQKLEPGNAKDEHEQTTKPFQAGDKDTMSSHLESRERPERPHRQWNCPTIRCLSRKCSSSSKLQLVPGQRESDLEVDQSWHLWDRMKYKGDRTLSFRLRVSKEQIPLDSGQMSFTEIHFQPISCQYTSRKHTTSYHTECIQLKKSIHPLHWQSTKFENLEMRRMSTSRLQNLSPNWRQKQHEQPLGIPGKAWAPSSPMELSPKSMLVTEVFVFKASASAWPKGKRHGSRSKLTSVRPHEIQRRQNSQFPTPSFQRTNPTGFRANVVYRDSFPANIMPIYQ